MTKSAGDGKSTKCFSAILSRLLCTGSLPTHPSDEFVELNTSDQKKPQEVIKLQNVGEVKQDAHVSKPPGVVARLMGLESLPSSPLRHSNRTLGSYLRSRSVNSIDFLSHFDPVKKAQHQHRRNQTSVSFREGLDKDYGLVLQKLKEEDETEEFMKIKKRPKVNCEQVIKKGKGIRIQKNENLLEKNVKKDFHGRTRVDSKGRKAVMKRVDCKEGMVGLKKCVKKKQRKQSLAHVVHSGQCRMKQVHFEAAAILPEVPPRVKHSRKPLCSDKESSHKPYPSNVNCDNREVEVQISGRKLKNEESCYYKRMVEEIFRMTKEDLEQGLLPGKLEDFEDICQQFGQEILEDLIEQFVGEQFLLYVNYLGS